MGQDEARLKEAAKLGFGRALVPRKNRKKPANLPGMSPKEVGHLEDLVALFRETREGPKG